MPEVFAHGPASSSRAAGGARAAGQVQRIESKFVEPCWLISACSYGSRKTQMTHGYLPDNLCLRRARYSARKYWTANHNMMLVATATKCSCFPADKTQSPGHGMSGTIMSDAHHAAAASSTVARSLVANMPLHKRVHYNRLLQLNNTPYQLGCFRPHLHCHLHCHCHHRQLAALQCTRLPRSPRCLLCHTVQ